MFSLSIFLPYGWFEPSMIDWASTFYDRKLSKNKTFEWQTDHWGWNHLFSIDLELISTGSDHARFGVSITILGFMLSAMIYDHRHWNSATGTWEDTSIQSNP